MRFALAFTLCAQLACASTDPGVTPMPVPPRPVTPEGLSIVAPPDVAAPPVGAKSTGTGLAYVQLAAERPEGLRPDAGDDVRIQYVGWTASGRPFDDVLPPLEPLRTRLSKLPLGLVEGLQLMREGDTFRFWLPTSLTNAKGLATAPPGMLVYDVKLVSVIQRMAVVTYDGIPTFQSEPPPDAQTTATGLVTKVMRPGDGAPPTRSDKVKVHYTGWTTDGKMFDSSVARGEPATFPVSGVIAGFGEGLMLMRPGERRVLWIPEALAYQGKPGAPQGMLIFDVVLIDIE